MARLPLILLLALLLAPLLSRAEEPYLLRSSITPEKDLWVGQQATLFIDVMSPDGWAQIAKVPSIEVPGAYVFVPTNSRERIQESINGKNYSGQRYQVAIFPQRSGELTIPEIPVDIKIRTFGINRAEKDYLTKTKPLTFSANRPPGTEKLRYFLTTPKLTAKQSWSTEESTFKVGDAIKRSVTLKAQQLPGMAFPPFRSEKLEGIGTYPANPSVEDQGSGLELVGTRTESVTYVFESPGEFELPSATLAWFNTKTGELEKITLEGRTITISGTPRESAEGPAAASPRDRRRNWTIIGSIAALLILLAYFAKPLATALQARLAFYRNSEPARFRAVLTAAKSQNAAATTQALMCWIDLTAPPKHPTPARLDQFLSRYGTPDTHSACHQLQQSLASGTPLSNPTALTSSLQHARRNYLASQKQSSKQSTANSTLPPLNP